MPSPIVPSNIEETVPSSTGSICSKLEALWSLATKLLTFWEWAWNEDGTATDAHVQAFYPTGMVSYWPVNTGVPDGWLTCNGAIVSRSTYAALFGEIGVTFGAGDGSTTFQLPDYRDKFLIGASGTKPAASTGGSETVTLTVPNLPVHRPQLATGLDFFIMEDTGNGTDALDTTNQNIVRVTSAEAFAAIGEDEPFSVQNPYAAGHWIIRT
jgi:microcystin-dependent protein